VRVCGFTFVRNALVNAYPVCAAVRSVLPLCDEFQLVVADSTDDTWEHLSREFGSSPKVHLSRASWDETLRSGGRLLARLTDTARERCRGDWGVYIQADEALHERWHPAVRACLEYHLSDPEVEGLLFRYRHFYGSYDVIHTGRKWYRREVRVIRLGAGLRSWGDAMGFEHIDGRFPRVVWAADAEIYHYGWARPAEEFRRKQEAFDRLYTADDELLRRRYADAQRQVYKNSRYLVPFTGSHPGPLRSVVEAAPKVDWPSGPYRDRPFHRFVECVERRLFGGRVRFGEPRHFRLLRGKSGPDGFPDRPRPFDEPPTD
jgi:hypothetical protein